jgi:hypothetical protein
VSDNPQKTITVTLVTASLPAGDAVDSLAFTQSNQPDGLLKLVPSSQTIDSSGGSGDALAFATMDALIDLQKDAVRPAFVANAAIIRKYLALVRALGGTAGPMIRLPGLDQEVISYRGIPILKNDWILSNEVKTVSTLSSMYLLDLNGNSGFFAAHGGGAMDVEASPRNVRISGLKVRNVGELEDKEAQRQRVSFYGAFGIGSDLSVARARELVTV